MKFPIPSMHHSKVTKSVMDPRTHRQTDRQTDKLKVICPSNLLKDLIHHTVPTCNQLSTLDAISILKHQCPS